MEGDLKFTIDGHRPPLMCCTVTPWGNGATFEADDLVPLWWRIAETIDRMTLRPKHPCARRDFVCSSQIASGAVDRHDLTACVRCRQQVGQIEGRNLL
jgi:hypothetical protein